MPWTLIHVSSPTRWARLCPPLIFLRATLLSVGWFSVAPLASDHTTPKAGAHLSRALSQESGPRARASSFLLPAMGQEGGGQCWLPREPAEALLLLLWGLIPLHCLAQRTEHLLSCLYAKPVCISEKNNPLAGSCSPALGKTSRKSGNRKTLHKYLPKSLEPTERVPVLAVRAVHSLSDSSVGLDGEIPVTAKMPSSIYVSMWKESLCDRGQDPIRYKFGNGHPSNGSAQPFPFCMEVAKNTSA